MSPEQLKRILEAVLLAAGRPLGLDQLSALFQDNVRPSRQDIATALASLQADCAGRGVELREVASGYRYQVPAELAPWVSQLWEERPARYTRALLETLALIAYRQPVTRGEIEDVRGVAVSSSIIKTLHEREWIRIVGYRDVPGRPALYATTREFLDYFNLKSLEELPSLAEIRDLDVISAELDLALPDSASAAADAESGTEADVATATPVAATAAPAEVDSEDPVAP
jgi:segregation and condensation protein B